MQNMTPESRRLVDAALKLPLEARAALAGTLIESLDSTIDEDAAALWEAEVARRVAELDDGSVRTIPWSEARRRIIG
jgi:putative addiction module component (TIGR02574 family)